MTTFQDRLYGHQAEFQSNSYSHSITRKDTSLSCQLRTFDNLTVIEKVGFNVSKYLRMKQPPIVSEFAKRVPVSNFQKVFVGIDVSDLLNLR